MAETRPATPYIAAAAVGTSGASCRPQGRPPGPQPALSGELPNFVARKPLRPTAPTRRKRRDPAYAGSQSVTRFSVEMNWNAADGGATQ